MDFGGRVTTYNS